MQILNQIILPKSDETCSSLYFRGKRVAVQENQLVIEKGSKVSFDSYFNSFEHTLFQQKTNIQTVQFQFELQGEATITIYHCGYDPNVAAKECISVENMPKMKKTPVAKLIKVTTWLDTATVEVDLSTVASNGFLYAEIKAKQCCTLFSGCITTAQTQQNAVRICLALAANKKQESITNTAKSIVQYLENNQLQNDIHLYILDNDNAVHEIAGAKILHTKDLGLAGDATRAMLETLQGEYTHFVIANENMHFEVESIGRIYALLQNLKEVENTVIGGSVFQPHSTLQLSQAVFLEDTLLHIQQHMPENLDLAKVENLYKNTFACTAKNQFASWKSLVCYPKKVFQRHGFALPFYQEWTDIEFGLRMTECTFLYTHGIGAWNSESQIPYTPILRYYTERNLSITNLLHHRDNLLHLKNYMQNAFNQCLQLQRYDEASSLLQGYQDALKGVDHFLTNKEEYLFAASATSTFKEYTKEELFNLGYDLDILCDRKAKVEKNAKVHSFAHCTAEALSKELPNIQYNFETGRGFITQFDEKRELALKIQLQKITQELVQKYPYLQRAYKTAFTRLTCANTWEKLLQLPKMDRAYFERERFANVAYFVDTMGACMQLFKQTKRLLDARVRPILLTEEGELYTLIKNKGYKCYLLPKEHTDKIKKCMQILYENDIQILHSLMENSDWLNGVHKAMCRPLMQHALINCTTVLAEYDEILFNFAKAKKVTAVLIAEERESCRNAAIQMLQKQVFTDFNIVVVERQQPYVEEQKPTMEIPVQDALPQELSKVEGLAYFTLPSSATQAQMYQYALDIVRYSGTEWVYIFNEYVQLNENTLQKLVLATLGKEAEVSFVTSNIQCHPIETDTYALRIDRNQQYNRDITSTSFASILINSRAISQFGMPLKMFRNDLCDREYTLRLSAAFGNGIMQTEDAVLLADAPRLRDERMVQRYCAQLFLADAYLGKAGLALEKKRLLTDTKHKNRKNKKRLKKMVSEASKQLKEMPVTIFNNRYDLHFAEEDIYVETVAKTTSKKLLVKYEQGFSKCLKSMAKSFDRKGKYTRKANFVVVFAPEKIIDKTNI